MLSETDLANQLKKQCLPNGVEINPKESAKTLHQLGLVYKGKSPDKISLIQSVALMTSAALRQPDNVHEVRTDLKSLCLHILNLANASKQDLTLLDNAIAEAKHEIAKLRQTTQCEIKKLKPINDDFKGPQLIRTRKQRVQHIRKIQDYVSETYTKIMQLIAKSTIDIMGEPPCKFAIVGMGSLARREITPYSDFENIIVLEETVGSISPVLAYFQWFATVFQIILVRLGETILRFLAIPCLNNPLVSEENWFYDAYTPCGICPDGFAPQASKNPLGRQTMTKKKPWITELIKPVSQMVKYLDAAQDIKNGYHLADMLTSTCFVYGNYVVYHDFENKVKQKTNNLPIFTEKTEESMVKDFEQYSVASSCVGHALNIKHFAFRSCSLFIIGLGRLYDCKFSNCFEIVDKLRERRIIDTSLQRRLQFSLSVGCEMRLRIYNLASSQSDILHQTLNLNIPSCITNIATCIGPRALVDGLTITKALQLYVKSCFTVCTRYDPSSIVERPFDAAEFAGLMKLHRLAIKLVHECKDMDVYKNKKHQVVLLATFAFSLHGCEEYKKCVDVIEANLPIMKKVGLINEACVIMIICARSLVDSEKIKKALKYYRKVNFYHFFKLANSVTKLRINIGMGDCFKKLGRNQKALKYLKLAYNEVIYNPNKKVGDEYNELLMHYCVCLNRSGRWDEAKTVGEELLKVRRNLYVDEQSDLLTNFALLQIGSCLVHQKRFEDALGYLKQSWQCEGIRKDFCQDTSATCMGQMAICLQQSGRSFEAIDLIQAYLIHNSDRNITVLGEQSLIKILIVILRWCGSFEACILYNNSIVCDYKRMKQTKHTCKMMKFFQDENHHLQQTIDHYDQHHIDDKTLQKFKREPKIEILHLLRLGSSLLKCRSIEEAISCYDKIERLLMKIKMGSFMSEDVEFHSMVYHEISYSLLMERYFQQQIKYSKKAFHLSFYIPGARFSDTSIDAAVMLGQNLYALNRYAESLIAAWHAIKFCLHVYPNCSYISKFMQAIVLYSDCEAALGMMVSSLPFHCAPSFFYNVPRRYTLLQTDAKHDNKLGTLLTPCKIQKIFITNGLDRFLFNRF